MGGFNLPRLFKTAWSRCTWLAQGRCNEGPAPPEFGLAASSPPFACAVLVEGGFIDIPASAGPRGTGLLLEGLHVKAAPPPGSADSTLLLRARSPRALRHPWPHLDHA